MGRIYRKGIWPGSGRRNGRRRHRVLGMDFGRKIIGEAEPPQVLFSGAVPLLLLR